MNTIPTHSGATDEESEAYRVLLARVGRKSPKIPADSLVRHVLDIVPAEEWPVRAEAMDALLRRLESVRRDKLRVKTRPEGKVLGPYTTGRAGSDARPYQTVVSAIDPIQSSCDCPDFLKSSLGLCKHVLVVLEHLHARPRLLQKARKEQEQSPAESGPRWNSIRPLTGAGNWLDRVIVPAPAEGKPRRGARWSRALKWFQSAENGSLVLKRPAPVDRSRRLALVEDLRKVVPRTTTDASSDPALRALLERERTLLTKAAKQAVSPAETKAALANLKRELYPYQREGVERFLASGRLLLADDMGLGKTAQAIASCDILWRTRRVRRVLIIAPSSLKPQWEREWASFSDLPIQVIEGTPAERQALYDSKTTALFIINYEQLIRDLDAVRRWRPDLVVLDEAQRIKNWATKTALSVKGLAPPYRLVLTGTPMENRIEELASIVEWVDDMALEPKWRLNALHSVHAEGRREIIGVRHLDTIRDRLRGCLLRRVRQDVLDQLPPRTDTRVPVSLTDSQLEEHDALTQPIASLVQRARTRPLSPPEFLKLMSLLTTQRVISNGMAQFRFPDIWPAIRSCEPEESLIVGLASPKLLELRQLVRQLVLEQDRKVVVFSQWRRMLSLARWAVGDLLSENDLRAGFFTGAEDPRRRTRNLVEFHDDPRCRLLFASDAGGVGLNLQHASNCVINLELPWNPAVLEQRIGRIYRLGQRQPIDVFNLVGEPGIESRIAGLVGSKQAFFKGLFDGEADAIQFERAGSFLSRIEKLYEPAPSSAAESSDSGSDDESLDLADSNIEETADEAIDDSMETPLEAVEESREPAIPPIETEPVEPIVSPLPPVDEVRHLFSRLQIRREANGRVVIEAPPEAASALGAVFEGMAALLRSAPEPRPDADSG